MVQFDKLYGYVYTHKLSQQIETKTTRQRTTFDENLKEIDDFTIQNKRLPRANNGDKEKQMYNWVTTQKANSKNEKHKEKQMWNWTATQKANYKNEKHNMKDMNREKWNEFVKKHPDLFISREEHWLSHCEKVDEFIEKYNKLPRYSKNNDKSLGYSKNNDEQILGAWVDHQKQYYKNTKKILKDENIREKWEELVNKYKYLFIK